MSKISIKFLLLLSALFLSGCGGGHYGNQIGLTTGSITKKYSVNSTKVRGKVIVASMNDLPKLRRQAADWKKWRKKGQKEGKFSPRLASMLSSLTAKTRCSDYVSNSIHRTDKHQDYLVKNGLTPATGKGYHPLGMAIDLKRVTCPNGKRISLKKVAEAAIKVGFRGIGFYRDGTIHLDVRTRGFHIWGVSFKEQQRLKRLAYKIIASR
ncbi:MAG: DUF882 domain-containing protein [Alphaproteobacteria bacterium]|nr:DUF882 domain-containing protein [Alphaproteobacteria bacterium]MDD9919405.1 DUF882 domain-containing protein [Alphaproteobacteria bacterium]